MNAQNDTNLTIAANPQVDFSGHFFTFGRAHNNKWGGGNHGSPDLVTLASVNNAVKIADMDMDIGPDKSNSHAFKSSLGKYNTYISTVDKVLSEM